MDTKKGLLLLSGGIDSPVAGYLMMKKGLHVDCIHFDNFSSGKTISKNTKIERILTVLQETQASICLYTIPFSDVQESFARGCDRRYQCILCKRMMHQVAEQVAKEHGYDCLINGDNLGQVASQTLSNMAVVDNTVKIPVIRPIICLDKNEIIKIARDIKTFDISTLPGDCCQFVPSNPRTSSTAQTLAAEEKKIDMKQIIEDAIKQIVIIDTKDRKNDS